MMFRPRTNSRFTAVLLLALMALDGSTLAATGVGPFTQAQVTAGRAAFLYSCAGCHGSTLQGNPSIPALTGPHFVDSWAKDTTKELYQFISASMPYDFGGSLSEETYTNIVTYILAVNGAKPGPTVFTKDTIVKIGTITDGYSVREVLNPPPGAAAGPPQ